MRTFDYVQIPNNLHEFGFCISSSSPTACWAVIRTKEPYVDFSGEYIWTGNTPMEAITKAFIAMDLPTPANI